MITGSLVRMTINGTDTTGLVHDMSTKTILVYCEDGQIRTFTLSEARQFQVLR